MSLLKSLALSLLSFLLFLSLSGFGLAFMAQRTVLNPDFAVAELNRLDLAELAGALIEAQTPAGEPVSSINTAYAEAVSDLEPLIKEQLSVASYSAYDYLLGRKPDPELKLILRDNFLSEDFLVAVIDQLDITSLAATYLKEQLSGSLPVEFESLNEDLDSFVDETVTELKPWLKEEARAAAGPLADYLLGDSPNLDVVISLEPVKEILREKLLAAFLESPPAELAMLPASLLEPLFNLTYAIFAQTIPTDYRINESSLGAELPSQIATALAETEIALQQTRQFFGYFQLGYPALIGLIALFVLGIILVSRQLKYISRHLGTSCLAYGALEYAGIYIGKFYAIAEIGRQELPAGLQTWSAQFLDNLVAPLVTFSLALMITGAVLIIVSFVYRARPD